MAEDKAQPLPHLGKDAGLPVTLGQRFRLPDPGQGRDGDEVGHGIGGERLGGTERLHQNATESRPGEERHRKAGRQLVVRLDNVLRTDQRWDVSQVGDVEDHVAYPERQRDDEQLGQRDRVEQEGDRDRGQRQASDRVGEDHERPASYAVGEDSGKQGEQGERKSLSGYEETDDERAGVETEDGKRRQRQEGDLAANDAYG